MRNGPRPLYPTKRERQISSISRQFAKREPFVIEGDLTDRLVIGTVQLGLPYGRHRASTVTHEDSAFRILDAAWSLGIRAFDTAEAYGSSARRLRAWSDSRGNAEALEIITKCSLDSPDESLHALEDRANKALRRFSGVRRVVLLTHGAVDADRWPALLAASAAHDAIVGQSVYSADDVSAACALPGMGRLQVPGNVLDSRAIRARGDSPVPLDVRSVYLQGVLLEAPHMADARAPGAAGITAAVQDAAAELDTSLASLLIATMLKVIRRDDRLVIGIDNVSQLDALPPAFEIPDDTVQEFRETVARLAGDPALTILLDPRGWPSPQPG
ncbi:MAG TPA: aldo/keto reductase [Gemmatimonadaceae bacterium]|nr:aldo/keto reductase [Gemmatimonadaceae bacterium]